MGECAHHGMAHKKRWDPWKFLVDMSNSPCNVVHLVFPTCLSIGTIFAFVILVQGCQTEPALVKGKNRGAMLKEKRVEMSISTDMFCKAVDKDDDSLGRSRGGVRSGVEFAGLRTRKPGFCERRRHYSGTDNSLDVDSAAPEFTGRKMRPLWPRPPLGLTPFSPPRRHQISRTVLRGASSQPWASCTRAFRVSSRYLADASSPTVPNSPPRSSILSLFKRSPETLSSFKKIVSLTRAERKPLCIAVGLLLVSSSISMSVPFTIGKLIDFFVSTNPVRWKIYTSNNHTNSRPPMRSKSLGASQFCKHQAHSLLSSRQELWQAQVVPS